MLNQTYKKDPEGYKEERNVLEDLLEAVSKLKYILIKNVASNWVFYFYRSGGIQKAMKKGEYLVYFPGRVEIHSSGHTHKAKQTGFWQARKNHLSELNGHFIRSIDLLVQTISFFPSR